MVIDPTSDQFGHIVSMIDRDPRHGKCGLHPDKAAKPPEVLPVRRMPPDVVTTLGAVVESTRASIVDVADRAWPRAARPDAGQTFIHARNIARLRAISTTLWRTIGHEALAELGAGCFGGCCLHCPGDEHALFGLLLFEHALWWLMHLLPE